MIKRKLFLFYRNTLCLTLPLALLSSCYPTAASRENSRASTYQGQQRLSTGQYIDDKIILASIKTKYVGDPDISGLGINIDVRDGNVELRGYVNSEKNMARAVEIARNTEGVRNVYSKLVLDN
jgi:osmotically-inducible protein OsmY